MSRRLVRLERTFEAPRERVFGAWTNPEVMRRWWAPGPDWSTPVAEADVRVGGQLRVTMASPDGETHSFIGEYVEVSPPYRLVYTSAWTGSVDESGTVSVDFLEHGGRTTVVLQFEADEDAAGGLESGWDGCLENLRRVLT